MVSALKIKCPTLPLKVSERLSPSKLNMSPINDFQQVLLPSYYEAELAVSGEIYVLLVITQGLEILVFCSDSSPIFDVSDSTPAKKAKIEQTSYLGGSFGGFLNPFKVIFTLCTCEMAGGLRVCI